MPRSKTLPPAIEEQIINFVQTSPLAQVRSTITTAGVLLRLRERAEAPEPQQSQSSEPASPTSPRRARKALGKGLAQPATPATPATQEDGNGAGVGPQE